MFHRRSVLLSAALGIGGLLLAASQGMAQPRGGVRVAVHPGGGGVHVAVRPAGVAPGAVVVRPGVGVVVGPRVGVGGGYWYYPGGAYASPVYVRNSYYYPATPVPAANPVAPAAVPVPTTPPPVMQPADTGTAASVKVVLPTADAELWFNGQYIDETGADRNFATPPLDPEMDYRYQVIARWTQNGKQVVDRRSVYVRAGGAVVIDFTRPASEVRPAADVP